MKDYSEFLAVIIDVYGDYKSPVLKKLTALYIKENFKVRELENILSKLLIELNPKFKTPPSPADFQEIFFKKSKGTEAEALIWWNDLNNKVNSWKDCIISDIRVQSAIETMGGWVWFCQRVKVDDSGRDLDQWHRKNFIELFKLYTENPPEKEIKVLSGLSEKIKAPLMIGDEKICLQIQDRNSAALKAIEEMTRGMILTNDCLRLDKNEASI